MDDVISGFWLLAASAFTAVKAFLCSVLGDGLGLDFTTDTPDAVLTRGELANAIYKFYQLRTITKSPKA